MACPPKTGPLQTGTIRVDSPQKEGRDAGWTKTPVEESWKKSMVTFLTFKFLKPFGVTVALPWISGRSSNSATGLCSFGIDDAFPEASGRLLFFLDRLEERFTIEEGPQASALLRRLGPPLASLRPPPLGPDDQGHGPDRRSCLDPALLRIPPRDAVPHDPLGPLMMVVD